MKMTDILKYNDDKDFVTPSGDRLHENFVGKLNLENGLVELKSVGFTDVFEEIQSHVLESDIGTLIKRAEAGDLSAFSSAVFGDFTEMPDSFAEALNVVMEAEREFNNLPADVREKFDNDYHKYITTAGSDDWLSKMGLVNSADGASGSAPAAIEKETTSEKEKE